MCSSVHVWTDTRIYYKEAQSLAENGLQVEFYALDYPAEKREIRNLTMHYLPNLSRRSRIQHQRTLWKAFQKSRAANFHFHDPELLFLAKKIKRKYGDQVKVVYDMHEHLPAAVRTKQWLPKFLRPILSQIVTKVERYLMKSVDAVIFAEKSYRENYPTESFTKIDILNYPITPPVHNVKKNKIFTMIYVGGLTEQRGLFNMLNLAATLKEKGVSDFQLKLIGPVLTAETKIKNFVRKKHLEEHVVQFDRLPYTEIWQHYHTSHLGLCLLHPTPNNLNSRSTKLFEYMAAGLPVLASDFSSFIEMMTTHKSGYTADPFDSSLLADLVCQVKNNPELAEQLGKNGEKAFFENYSWHGEAEKLMALYDERK